MPTKGKPAGGREDRRVLGCRDGEVTRLAARFGEGPGAEEDRLGLHDPFRG